jgi:toxin-antitoxin system PIN domain toxin
MVLPDVNVLLALSNSAHVHSERTKRWFDSLAEELIFCRLTQLGLLRLLTNASVMGSEVRTQRQAWLVYDQFLIEGYARMMHEPALIDASFRKIASLGSASPQDWADSYLAAFAETGGLTLVTFDKALARKAKGSVLL